MTDKKTAADKAPLERSADADKAARAEAKKVAAAEKKAAAEKAAKVQAAVAAAEVMPLARGAVRLAVHSHQTHAVTVSGKTPDAPLNSTFWTNNAAKLNAGDEIRVLADDFSWVQQLLVTYKAGSMVAVTRMYAIELDDTSDIEDESDRFKVVPAAQGGGFIVRDTETGDQIGAPSPTRSKAERQREDHINALKL